MCKLIFVSDLFFGYLLGSTELPEKARWSTDENELRSPALCHRPMVNSMKTSFTQQQSIVATPSVNHMK